MVSLIPTELYLTVSTDQISVSRYVERSLNLKSLTNVKELIILGPGPGEYRIFSEFGIYESKNARTEENKQTNFNSYKNTTVKTTTNF